MPSLEKQGWQVENFFYWVDESQVAKTWLLIWPKQSSRKFYDDDELVWLNYN